MSAPGPQRKAKTKRDDWETPPHIFKKLDDEFHFTLDAAASPENAKVENYITKEQDALHFPWINWYGDPLVVFLNPPYGKGLDKWVHKCYHEAWAYNTVVALLPAVTDTKWFTEEIWKTANEIRFVAGRISFVGSTSGNTTGSMIAVWYPRPRPFLKKENTPKCSIWYQPQKNA